jgi:hypothetical protein
VSNKKKHQRHKKLYPPIIKSQIEHLLGEEASEPTVISPDLWDDTESLESVERIRKQDRALTRKAEKEAAKRQREREVHRMYKRVLRDHRREQQG